MARNVSGRKKYLSCVFFTLSGALKASYTKILIHFYKRKSIGKLRVEDIFVRFINEFLFALHVL
jgi:hypothetical protein